MSSANVGDVARIEIIRDRGRRRIDAQIGKRPHRPEDEARGFEVPRDIKEWRGIQVIDITDDIAKELDLTDREGVVIIECSPSGSCHEAGLRKGDVIREINRTRIRDVSDFNKVTAEAKGPVLVRTDGLGYTIVK